MKIEPQNKITVQSTGKTGEVFKGLKEGAQIKAQIAIRHSSKEAVIDIKGARIRAKFLRGVPQSNTIMLKLEKAKLNTYEFRLIDTNKKDTISDSIRKYTLLNSDKTGIYQLNKFLKGTVTGIFELHLLLFQIKKEYSTKKNVSHLLNRMIQAGINPDLINDLSFILSSSKNIHTLMPLLLFLTGREDLRKWQNKSKNDIENTIDKLLNEIDDIKDEDEKGELFKLLFKLAFYQDERNGKASYGVFPLKNDDEFISVSYIHHNDNILLSMDLSLLGHLEIMAKKENNYFTLSIFCAKKESIPLLEESLGYLRNRLGNNEINALINIYNIDKIINKIVEINSYYSLNSDLDIKI